MSAPKHIRLTILCTPQTRLYLHSRYGKAITLSMDTGLEKCIIALLNRNAPIYKNYDMGKYTQTVALLVPEHLVYRIGARAVSNFTIVAINQLIEELYSESLSKVFEVMQNVKSEFISDNMDKISNYNYKRIDKSSLKIKNMIAEEAQKLGYDPENIESLIRTLRRKKH